ncbi:MAG: acyl-CoA dehydrogenase family protein [Paracoccaceae bacterium]
MPYQAPTAEYDFLLNHVTNLNEVAQFERFEDVSDDLVSAIITECGRLCTDKLAPLNSIGDLHPATLDNGVVRSSPGFADGYAAIAEGGWTGISGDPEYGGMGLPISLATVVNDMMAGACLSLQLNPMMTHGQIEALEHHASDAIKALYLPKLMSGEWHGTMNLTEPHAGSDVGALSSKAEPKDDGSYAITGQKIYISWGDNDLTENTCHLVLARLPDGPKGVKGISLFIVPKLMPDENGNVGERNALRVVSLEHKMGLHGSPTAVMSYEGATGWLIGEPHAGMAAMFTMMNNARLGVGTQGIGVAEAAYQHALDYALERKQGRASGTGAIVEHADVKRMLATMKADVFAARAIALHCAKAIDMTTATNDAAWKARAALLTPIAKAFGTDTGMRVSEMGVQVHGGMGYIEETGAAQYYRDVRVTAIYEGTNGIQAMDLVTRKMMDGGEAAFAILDEIEARAMEAKDTLSDMATPVLDSARSLRSEIEVLVTKDISEHRLAVAYPFMTAFARVLGADAHLTAATSGQEPRVRLARFYINRMLPEITGLLAHVRMGGQEVSDITVDDLAA